MINLFYFILIYFILIYFNFILFYFIFIYFKHIQFILWFKNKHDFSLSLSLSFSLFLSFSSLPSLLLYLLYFTLFHFIYFYFSFYFNNLLVLTWWKNLQKCIRWGSNPRISRQPSLNRPPQTTRARMLSHLLDWD